MDEVIVATSTNSADDLIEEFCDENSVKCFRGSEDDVLGRIAGVIEKYQIDTHVELYGDCPLIDPHIVDELIGCYLKYLPKYDCVCNTIRTTYPPGQEALVHRGSILMDIDHRIATRDPMREHVGIHITKNPSYRVLNLEAPDHYCYPEMYLEVDTANDFDVVSQIIGHFSGQGSEHFSLAQMISYLQSHPDLVAINQTEERRWKEFRNDS